MRNRSALLAALTLAVGTAAAPGTGFAETGPKFTESVLEMTPETIERFAKALALEESSRKAIAAKANAPLPKGTKTREEYQQCQMELYTSPEFQQLMQDMTAALSGMGKDPAGAQRAAQDMQTKMDAEMEKKCGPDPDKTYRKPDVGSEIRKAQSEAARSTGFTDRQYAIIKERVTPLCLSDPAPAGPDGLKIRGEGSVFFVYTAAEVETVRPRCEALTGLMGPAKR